MLETFKNKLDSVGVTNPSKLYTPFTLFCIFFSIYLNADLLGQIFLSGMWEVQEPALKAMANRLPTEWFMFIGKVVAYSLVMILIYGLTQALAAFLWGIADWANTSLSAMSNKSKYVSKEEFEKVVADSNELRRKERELYSRIASYHTWKPEDIDLLSNQLKEAQDSYSSMSAKNSENEAKADSLNQELQQVNTNLDAQINAARKEKDFLVMANKEMYFFRGYMEVINWFKSNDIEIPDAKFTEEKVWMIGEIMKKLHLFEEIKEAEQEHISKGLFSTDRNGFTILDKHSLSFQKGAMLSMFEKFDLADVEIESDNVSTHIRYSLKSTGLKFIAQAMEIEVD